MAVYKEVGVDLAVAVFDAGGDTGASIGFHNQLATVDLFLVALKFEIEGGADFGEGEVYGFVERGRGCAVG